MRLAHKEDALAADVRAWDETRLSKGDDQCSRGLVADIRRISTQSSFLVGKHESWCFWFGSGDRISTVGDGWSTVLSRYAKRMQLVRKLVSEDGGLVVLIHKQQCASVPVGWFMVSKGFR